MSLPNPLWPRKTSLVRSPSYLRESSRTGKLNKLLRVGTGNRQVKKEQFPALVSGLSMAERYQVLDLPEVNAVKPLAKTPATGRAVELSEGNPGPGALPRELFRSAVGEISFGAATRKFSN